MSDLTPLEAVTTLAALDGAHIYEARLLVSGTGGSVEFNTSAGTFRVVPTYSSHHAIFDALNGPPAIDVFEVKPDPGPPPTHLELTEAQLVVAACALYESDGRKWIKAHASTRRRLIADMRAALAQVEVTPDA